MTVVDRKDLEANDFIAELLHMVPHMLCLPIFGLHLSPFEKMEKDDCLTSSEVSWGSNQVGDGLENPAGLEDAHCLSLCDAGSLPG